MIVLAFLFLELGHTLQHIFPRGSENLMPKLYLQYKMLGVIVGGKEFATIHELVKISWA